SRRRCGEHAGTAAAAPDRVAILRQVFDPHPEERRLRRVSKDAGPSVASWFETRFALLTMRDLVAYDLPRNLARSLRDQPRRALCAGVDPQPAQRDAEAVAQADQEVDVGEAPDPPGEVAAHLDPAEIDHGLLPADLRETAGMLVAEWRQRAAAETRLDQRGHVAPLLLGGRRDARHRIA